MLAVVALCCSTALAIAHWMSLICRMTAPICPIASTALCVSPWMVSMR
jgi:hypothetical protein